MGCKARSHRSGMGTGRIVCGGGSDGECGKMAPRGTRKKGMKGAWEDVVYGA